MRARSALGPLTIHSLNRSRRLIRKAQPKPFRNLVIGFHLLAIFWVMNLLFPAQGLSIEKIVVSALLLISVVFWGMQIASRRAPKKRLDGFTKLIFALLIIWCLVTIARGFDTDAGRLFTWVANPEIGAIVWLLPFAILLGRQEGALHALLPVFRWHVVLGVTLICGSLVVGEFGESLTKAGLILLYAAPVALILGMGGSADRRVFMVSLCVGVVTHIALSNRAGGAMAAGYLLISLALGRVRDFNRISIRVIGVGILVALLVMFGAEYVLARLSEDWFVDTRTFLWEEMNDDFGLTDWMIGRGALGSYYSPYFDMTSRQGLGGDWMYRQVNEIGYMHIALKAGLVGVVLYVLVFARAVFRSLFIANKRLGIGIAILLSMHLVEMLVVGQASFQPSRIMLWILAGVALSCSTSSARSDKYPPLKKATPRGMVEIVARE